MTHNWIQTDKDYLHKVNTYYHPITVTVLDRIMSASLRARAASETRLPCYLHARSLNLLLRPEARQVSNREPDRPVDRLG
jgi:hypothetical protein